MKRKSIALVLSLLFAGSLLAQPAPWYQWRSKLNGKIFCNQTSPGEGWERVSGPFKDARCEKPA
jgi:hypothetical protein